MDFRGSIVSGYAIFLAAIATLPLFAANNMRMQATFLAVLVAMSLLLMLLLREQAPYGESMTFEHSGTMREPLANALSILLFTFFVRLYRQTAEPWIVALLPTTFALLPWIGMRSRKRPRIVRIPCVRSGTAP